MPFNIVRNDITLMHTDAIVNTANPNPVIGGGTDSAIYAAAGEEQLLAERKKIGKIERGQAAATPAFNLHAKYIIHTVGPVWDGGNNGEFETLAACYANSLKLAEELGCESISFPMISTGVYGFPKDKALTIALGAISAFLNEHDMEVTLVVFDRDSFQISGQIRDQVQAFIDDEYALSAAKTEYEIDDRIFGERSEALLEELPAGRIVENERRRRSLERAELEKAERESKKKEPASPYLLINGIPEIDIRKKPDPKELKKKIGETFQDRLFKLMLEKDMTNSEVYHRANITKQTFSKICKPGARTTKPMVFALAIALKLNIEEANDLLAHAGYAFAEGEVQDVIVRSFILAGNYDIYQLNAFLFDANAKLLGSAM